MSTRSLNTAHSRIHAAAGRTMGILCAAVLATSLAVPALAAADEAESVEAVASSSIAYAVCAAESQAVGQLSSTDEIVNPISVVLDTAYDLQGTPYRAGGATPETGFDCSGFTMYCFSQIGVSLTHNAQAQYNQGTKVDKADLQVGDLVFFGGSTSSISHVGIYVGDDQYIHSKQTGSDVRVEQLSERTNFVGAVRVI